MYATVKDKKVPRWQQHELWNDKFKILFCVVLIIFVFTIWLLHYELHNRPDWYSARPEDRPFSDLMLSPKDHVDLKEIVCGRFQDHCYYITDIHVNYGKVIRRLQMEPRHHSMLSASYLDANGNVNKKKIWPMYARLALQAPFLFNVSGFPEGGKRALEIGLGAGTAGAYLEHLRFEVISVEIEPMVVHIAKKWFDTPGSGTQHTVITGDGYLYVKNYKEDAPKFDFTFVDTSYTDDLHLLSAPVEIFVTTDFVKALRNMMNNECAVVVNTYCHHTELDKMLEAERHRHATLLVYRKYFGTCFYLEAGLNTMLFCSCKPIPKMDQYKYDYFLSHMPPELYKELVVDAKVREEW